MLSFKLGLLWPHFMKFAGPIIGLGFGLEGFAFFTEAIFLGIYIYGWDRVPPLAHWLAGAIIALSGALSGILVVSVNAWMNTPAGFVLQGSKATSIDPPRALLSPAMIAETLHMTLAAYAATGLLVAGIHAVLLLNDRANPFHRRALAIALAVGGVASVAAAAQWALRRTGRCPDTAGEARSDGRTVPYRAPGSVNSDPFTQQRLRSLRKQFAKQAR